jgi:DNA mismatch repair protein MutS
MNELRTILRQADDRTLVLGNEISSSTETISATGIITSAILSLIKAGATFIFATHVHDVVELPHIKELKSSQLKIAHLTVHKDPTTNHLIYERILKEGSGPSTYGILVAESLELPQDFIDKAYEVVQFVSGNSTEIINHKMSRYNSDVYIHNCALCGRTSDQTILHTHHILEQHMADPQGHIVTSNEIIHKNKRDNLIVLCQECHTKLHNSKHTLETVTVTNGKIVRIKS